MLQYGIGIDQVTVGDIFRKMEEIEKDLDIEDYSVSQNTLDNVRFCLHYLLHNCFMRKCFS